MAGLTEEQKARLTPKQQYQINWAIQNVRLENMEPSEKDVERLVQMATGEKTIDEVIKEIKEE